MFAGVKTKRHEVVRAEGSEVDVDVDRVFKFRGTFGRGWELKSRVKVLMDDEGRVGRFEDCWTGVWLPKVGFFAGAVGQADWGSF